MKYGLLILLIMTFTFTSVDALAECSQADALAAENSTDHLKSWPAVHDSYAKYKQCDDGAIAEGYSDDIVKLLANDWRSLDPLRRYTSSDSGFYRFVLSHIDATTDWDDLKKIVSNASHDCPKNASKMCIEIQHKAAAAYKEARSF